MPRLTRRRLFAAGGAAGAAGVLAACGVTEAESERSAEADGQLLLDAASAEANVALIAEQARRQVSGLATEVLATIASSSAERARGLEPLLEEARVEPPTASESASSLASLAEATAAAAGSYREAATLLSAPEARKVALESIAGVAEELAVLRLMLGEEPSPSAFVTGGVEEPYEDTDFDPTEDE